MLLSVLIISYLLFINLFIKPNAEQNKVNYHQCSGNNTKPSTHHPTIPVSISHHELIILLYSFKATFIFNNLINLQILSLGNNNLEFLPEKLNLAVIGPVAENKQEELNLNKLLSI